MIVTYSMFKCIYYKFEQIGFFFGGGVYPYWNRYNFQLFLIIVEEVLRNEIFLQLPGLLQ